MVGLGTYPTLALSNSSHLFTVSHKPSKAPGGGVLSLSLRSSDFLVILSLIDSFSVPPASTSGTRVTLEASLNPNTFLSYKCRAYRRTPILPPPYTSHGPTSRQCMIPISITTFCLRPLAIHITQWSNSGRIRGYTGYAFQFLNLVRPVFRSVDLTWLWSPALPVSFISTSRLTFVHFYGVSEQDAPVRRAEGV